VYRSWADSLTCQLADLLLLVLGFATLMSPVRGWAQQRPAEQSIREVLHRQVADWNRGDVVAFMQGYEDSPQTTFLGTTIQHGYQAILSRYRTKYADRAAMGTLSFSDLDVRMMGADYALVTGAFHLERGAAAGGNASGIFSLIFHETASGWKIIVDHTS
jgi:ketosteroid isomerase-like protein